MTLKEKIALASEKIKNADAIIIGGGAGLSAAGGIDYMDTEYAKKNYPQYYSEELRTVPQMQARLWTMQHAPLEIYWAFWSQHILNVRHDTPLTEGYKILYEIFKDKNYFVITTNVDHQFFKSKLDKTRIFSMQGDYGTLQCKNNCQNKVYNNKVMFRRMQENKIDDFTIRTEDIPYCPDCGECLVINFRMMDDADSTARHMQNSKKYIQFVKKNSSKNVIFLELGVGYNTPGIIRYPFEDSTKVMPHAFLARVNNHNTKMPPYLKDKSVVIDESILSFLKDLLKTLN